MKNEDLQKFTTSEIQTFFKIQKSFEKVQGNDKYYDKSQFAIATFTNHNLRSLYAYHISHIWSHASLFVRHISMQVRYQWKRYFTRHGGFSRTIFQQSVQPIFIVS